MVKWLQSVGDWTLLPESYQWPCGKMSASSVGESYQQFNICVVGVTLPDTWYHRVSAETGWLGVGKFGLARA